MKPGSEDRDKGVTNSLWQMGNEGVRTRICSQRRCPKLSLFKWVGMCQLSRLGVHPAKGNSEGPAWSLEKLHTSLGEGRLMSTWWWWGRWTRTSQEIDNKEPSSSCSTACSLPGRQSEVRQQSLPYSNFGSEHGSSYCETDIDPTWARLLPKPFWLKSQSPEYPLHPHWGFFPIKIRVERPWSLESFTGWMKGWLGQISLPLWPECPHL